MGSSGMERERLEMFEVGPCKDAYQMGFLIGRRFSEQIRSRVARDLILQNQLRPFAHNTPQSEPLLKALYDNNRRKFPRYWDELLGTAAGSGVPLLDVIAMHSHIHNLAHRYFFTISKCCNWTVTLITGFLFVCRFYLSTSGRRFLHLFQKKEQRVLVQIP